ncbi:precorrin-8X methylmutase [Chroogloeocystis siderophila]|uniref:MerR family transcriptional regulator n=1 Tax=Chroogloeocystis siderophila 5.2 s.c.1 TaxID=247279 RepID=A0A1U7HP65_9CHRO|nr:precorrin-8X methylmutase [Chroogloeocystis siderophila]OKH25367.1 MerR family transcriptional regulator [Chroogloeocystis siderophila 5.2 s.c.1]
MANEYLTIKELTETVGGNMTPRMVRHYHQVGLLPQPVRSHSNYRLYTQQDVQQLRRIVALKQQGFQLSHIRQLLETDSSSENTLTTQLQQQYQSVMQQLARLRQTAAALEGLLGRDRACQNLQAEAIAQLRLLEVETQDGLGQLEQLWDSWDAATHDHPEAFAESLQRLLPDLSDRSEIEADLLSKLVLACGDVSLVNFVRLGNQAIAAARNALSSNCQVVGDVPAVVAAFDQTRLKHLGCKVTTLIDDPHITSAAEAEQVFWHQHQRKLQQLERGCVLVVGYAPSVLMAVCDAIENGIQPALIIGMPIGFSHAPAAKRRLMRSRIPFITTEGTLGGGLLAAVALNALAESLIEKPDCHCYLDECN